MKIREIKNILFGTENGKMYQVELWNFNIMQTETIFVPEKNSEETNTKVEKIAKDRQLYQVTVTLACLKQPIKLP